EDFRQRAQLEPRKEHARQPHFVAGPWMKAPALLGEIASQVERKGIAHEESLASARQPQCNLTRMFPPARTFEGEHAFGKQVLDRETHDGVHLGIGASPKAKARRMCPSRAGGDEPPLDVGSQREAWKNIDGRTNR